MGKIILTTNDVKRLIDWRDNGQVVNVRQNRYFAFEKCEILITDKNKIINVISAELIKENLFEFKLKRNLNNELINICDFKFLLSDGWGSIGRVIEEKFYNGTYNAYIRKNFIQDVLAVYFATNYYAISNKTVKVASHISERSSKSEPIKTIGKKKYVIKEKKLTRVIYSNRNTVDVEKITRGFYNYNKVQWEVRGHIRTYKSGKKVWIKPTTRKRKINIEEVKDKTIDNNIYSL